MLRRRRLGEPSLETARPILRGGGGSAGGGLIGGLQRGRRLAATLSTIALVGALAPSGASAQPADGASPVLAVALRSSLADMGAATLLVAADRADAVLPIDAPDMTGVAAIDLVNEHGASGFVLVGGTAAISPDVEAELSALVPRATTSRVWGEDREATAAAVARLVLKSHSDPRGAVLALANGWSPADAAAAAAAVAGGAVDAVLWTSADALGEDATAVLKEFHVRQVLVVGGPAALSEQVASAAGTAAGPGARILRVDGATRTGTALMVARLATAGRISAAVIADGWDLPATAQAAALAAAAPDAAVLFSEPGGSLGDAAAAFLAGSAPERIWVLSNNEATLDELARSAKDAAPAARIARVNNLAGATAAAIEASRHEDDQTGADSGSNGGSSGGGNGSGGGGPQPPPTTAPPVEPQPPPTTPPPVEAPSAPSGVAASLAGHGSIRLTWDAHPEASSLTNIRIGWAATAPDTGAGTLVVSPTATGHTVGDLTGGVTYALTVTAVRSGRSATADAVQLMACAQPGPPTSPSATVSGTSVTVTWNAPAGRNCPVTGYVIERSHSGILHSDTVTGTRQLVVTGLAAGGHNFGIATLNPLGRSVNRAFTFATVS